MLAAPVLAAVMYLSLPMTAEHMTASFASTVREFPACSSFEVKKPKDDRVMLVDDTAWNHTIAGPWRDFLFADVESCRAAIGKVDARIQKTGVKTYTIILAH